MHLLQTTATEFEFTPTPIVFVIFQTKRWIKNEIVNVSINPGSSDISPDPTPLWHVRFCLWRTLFLMPEYVHINACMCSKNFWLPYVNKNWVVGESVLNAWKISTCAEEQQLHSSLTFCLRHGPIKAEGWDHFLSLYRWFFFHNLKLAMS